MFHQTPADLHVRECVNIYIKDLEKRISELQTVNERNDNYEVNLLINEHQNVNMNSVDVYASTCEPKSGNIKQLIEKFEEINKANNMTSNKAQNVNLENRLKNYNHLYQDTNVNEQFSKNDKQHKSVSVANTVKMWERFNQ